LTYLRLISFRFYAKVLRISPPNPSTEVTEALPPNQASSSTSPVQADPEDTTNDVQIHKIGGDLKIPAKEAQAKDDPVQYTYQVQILEEPHEKGHEKGKTSQKDKGQWCGRLVDVRSNMMR
jgi:bromodomain adjacent to zinc finger domain protein 1A